MDVVSNSVESSTVFEHMERMESPKSKCTIPGITVSKSITAKPLSSGSNKMFDNFVSLCVILVGNMCFSFNSESKNMSF